LQNNLRLVLLFWASFFCFFAQGQQVLPLTKINISTSVVLSLYNNEPFSEYTTSKGVQLQLGANLHKGDVLLTATTFTNTNPALTEYQSLLFTVGYLFNIPIRKNVWLKPHAAFGANYMMFEQNTNNVNNLRESELIYQLGLAFQIKLHKKLHLQAGSFYASTQTFHKQHQLFFQSGLMYYFNTPKAIQHFIN
jgi:hypothetical protein